MKKLLKGIVLSIAMLSSFAVFASNAAQCVQCKPVGGRFVRTGAPKGGCECQTVGGSSAYILDSPCGTGQRCEGARATQSGVKIDETTILEIAQIHPRFAVALASLNQGGGLKTWSQISLMPARLEAPEVINWLKPPTETKAFFREYQNRIVAGAKVIVIEFTLSKVNDTRAVIRGNIIDVFMDDPAATQLEIELSGGKVSSWRAY